MGSIALNYDSIYSAARNAKKVASNAEDYVSGLQRKIINKIDDLKGPSSAYASSAKGSANDKITRLNAKKTSYTDYATKLEKFVEDGTIGAKAVDRKVADNFEKNAEEFRDNNNIKINPVSQFFTFLSNKFSNSSDFARKISDTYSNIGNWISDKWDSVKEWYRYEGGKFWANIGKAALAIGIAIAVIVVTVLTGGIGLVAICAIVGSVIAIADGLVTIGSNIQALNSESSDPAWALKLSKTEKLSTFLRKVDTGNGTANKALSVLATGIDVVEIGCCVVTIASTAAQLGKNLPVLKNLVGDESKGLMKIFLDKSVRNSKGKAVISFKSFGNGLKTLATNPSARAQILNKVKGDASALFSKGNIKDTIRFHWKFGIKQTVTSLATSPEARSRYAGLLKTQIGTNVSKFWKESFGNAMNGSNLVDKVSGYKNIMKYGKSGLDTFMKSASSGDVSKNVTSGISGILKDTYLSMDKYAKKTIDIQGNFKDIKENYDKILKLIGNMKPGPSF